MPPGGAVPRSSGPRCTKVARTPKGQLTYLKITGGSLRVKTPLTGGEGDALGRKSGPDPDLPGAKYRAVEEAEAGTVCAVTGLSRTRPGEGLGFEAAGQPRCWSRCSPTGWSCRRGAIPTRLSGSCGSWRRRTPSSTSCGTSACGRSISSSWGGAAGDPPPGHPQRFGVEVSFGAGSIVYRGDHRRAGGGSGPL